MKTTIRFSIIFISLIFITCDYSTKIQNINENNFDSLVKNDEHVWVIEIASKMCGSCQEFSPIFNSVSLKIKNLKYGVVYVDSNEGLNLAMKLDVLDKGLPAVLIFNRNGDQSNSFKQLVAGNLISEPKLTESIYREISGLSLRNGYYLKNEINSDL
jgi:hypothetical protein